MQLIGKGWLLFSFLLACALLALLGWHGYRVFGVLDSTGGLEGKYQAEHFLYLSLLGALLVLLTGAMVMVRARRLFRELDKVAELTRQGQFPASEYLRRLGPLGPKIELIYSRLAELNEAKSLKIGALSNLNKFLVENIGFNLMVLDIRGRVIQSSKSMLARLGMEGTAFVDQPIGELLAGLNFEEVRAELERSNRAVVKEGLLLLPDREPAGPAIFFPVRNSRGELANVIVALGKEGISRELSVPGEQVPAKGTEEPLPYLERLRKRFGWR